MKQTMRACGPGLLTAGLCAALAAGWLFISGCEVEPSETFAISVTPASASLHGGQSQVFVASGGITYKWSVTPNTPVWGTLSANTGESVTYTSILSPTSDAVVVTLTVVSTLGGSGTVPGGTNTTTTTTGNGTASANAYISHIP